MIKYIAYFTTIPLLIICFAAAQPKIQVLPDTKFDFGDVFVGTKPIQIMIVKNTGTETLDISQVSASCGCTAAMLTRNKLEPSDTGKLSITFNTTNQSGHVSKHVFINSNDPKYPKITIDFTANVVTALNITPNFFSFIIKKADSVYTRTMTLANNTKESIKILSVETKFDNLKVSLMKNQLMPGEQTELQAVLHPDKLGSFQGMIELKTNHPVQSKIEIRVYEWSEKY